MEKTKYVKAVYGCKAYENKETIRYGNTTICAWMLIGYDTVEALEESMSDEKILAAYEAQLAA